MLNTFRGIMRAGKIEPLEQITAPEGSEVLITILPPAADSEFWLGVSQVSLARIWDNPEDDVYAELLDK